MPNEAIQLARSRRPICDNDFEHGRLMSILLNFGRATDLGR